MKGFLIDGRRYRPVLRLAQCSMWRCSTWPCLGGRSRFAALVVSCVTALTLQGCGILREKPAANADEMALVGKPIPPDQAGEILNEVGGNFIYGPGLGEAVVNVGTVVAFPPYALLLVGNAILSVSGYEPVTISGFLPDEQGKQWSNAVDDVFSGPGRVVAALAGHEARSREVSEEKVRTILAKIQNADSDGTSTNGAVKAFRSVINPTDKPVTVDSNSVNNHTQSSFQSHLTSRVP